MMAHWRLLAGSLIVLAAALRIWYFASDCPLDLAPDEAHYWDWSRHLDWSYYSKGPAVAYLIRGGCLIAGEWSRQLIGSEMIAVRLPAVLCGSLLLVGLYVLTVLVYRDERLACAVVAIALTMPLIAAGASIMTIDAPYTCCWSWALVATYLAIFRGARWAWPVAGLLVGIGILAKYTMVLFIPSLTLFLLFTLRERLRQPGIYILTATAMACCAPILIWNMQHDWVTLKHLSGHAGVHSQTMVHWLGPLAYVGTQFGLLLGFWFVVWNLAIAEQAPWREARPERSFLWWMSVPMFAVFLLFSLKNGGGEPNWPVTAYISGLVLAAGWLSERMRSPRPFVRRGVLTGVLLTCGIGLLATLTLHNIRWVQPALARLAGPPSERHPLPLRRFDPTCRLRGWRTLAAAIDELRSEIHAREGVEPVLAGTSWSVPGAVGFYCTSQPAVYSLGLAVGDRHSQYDLWRPNPLADAGTFRGRTFIVVGMPPTLAPAFGRISTTRTITYSEGPHAIARWTLTVGHDFRGVQATPAAVY